MSEQAPFEDENQPDIADELQFEFEEELAPDEPDDAGQDNADDLADRIDALLAEETLKPVFPMRLNTDSTFQESLLLNGSMGDFSYGRSNDTTNMMTHLSDGAGLVVELEDADPTTGLPRMGWLNIPNPATAVYLTNNTGGGYDVFADAGKTIKLATNQSPETASALFQWNGTAGRLILSQPGAHFTVLVVQNGTSSPPVYDLYSLADTGHVTKLNTDGALAPECSRARLNAFITPVAASDGTTGSAYYGTDGKIRLFDCQESVCKS